MGFSIYNLFKAGLLVCNGTAILHPKRFLVKHGLVGDAAEGGDPIKSQVAGLLQAVSYLKGQFPRIIKKAPKRILPSLTVSSNPFPCYFMCPDVRPF